MNLLQAHAVRKNNGYLCIWFINMSGYVIVLSRLTTRVKVNHVNLYLIFFTKNY